MKSVTINEAKKQLKRIKDIYKFIKDENVRTSDSILTIIGRKYHDENAISDYLAYVLDPQLNGVGYQPINNFLALLYPFIKLNDTDHISIEREFTLPNNRRIDFLITINSEVIIAIEHKVFSEEHGDQTWNYEQELKNIFQDNTEDISYVFLTPNGKTPLNPAFTSLNYRQLVSALKDVNINFISDIRKAVLFNELIFHLEGYFLDDKNIALSNKTLLYLEHQEMIQDIKNQFERDYYYIYQYIESVFKNYFSNNFDGEWGFDFKKNRSYHQIYKPHWKEKGLNIHFELILSQNSLINHDISFLLDIEGQRKKDFKAVHDKKLKKKLTELMTRHGILCRQGRRADTFAHKSYYILTDENLKNESVFKKQLINMIEEFTGFIDPIDQEINDFHNN